jgi:nucleolar GTP-binding protein
VLSLFQVGKQYASKAAKARNRKEAAEVEAEGLETLQNMYKKGSSFVDRLKQLAKQLRRLPVVETETPTVTLT